MVTMNVLVHYILMMSWFLFQANTDHVYNYQFGDDNYGWSPVYSFKVPPKSDPNAGIKIITFGIKKYDTCFMIYLNSLPPIYE